MSSRNSGVGDIDAPVMENAVLDPVPVDPSLDSLETKKSLLHIQSQHLNVMNELTRLIGPEDPKQVKLSLQPHRERVLKGITIVPTRETKIYDFQKLGLSMSMVHPEQACIYLTYNHDSIYQNMHQAFLQRYAKYHLNSRMALLGVEEAKKTMHVEALLEAADKLFRMEEANAAIEIIENIVAYLQFVAPPALNLADPNVRLLYLIIENRPFHVVMLKYLYLLSHKAYHRTALEIAKMLLNLDPNDALAILLIIDTLAIRATEYQWLIEAIEYFNETRQSHKLFNFLYSYALAHFHVAEQQQGDLSHANKFIQKAIMSYPQVAVKLLEYNCISEPRIKDHPLFANDTSYSECLSELIDIYTRLIYSRWCEPKVRDWFLKNLIEVVDKYNNKDDVKELARWATELRSNFLRAWPKDILRHVTIIRPMAKLLLQTTIRRIERFTSSWDPLLDPGINRYRYICPADPMHRLSPGSRALLQWFYSTFLPYIENMNNVQPGSNNPNLEGQDFNDFFDSELEQP